MIRIKKAIRYMMLVFVTILIIPVFITIFYSNRRNTYHVNAAQQEYVVQPIDHNTIDENEIINENETIDAKEVMMVYNPGFEIVNDIGIEEYVKGVVAAEMPVSFEMEALKAQAVAARTYALKAMQNNQNIEQEDIGQAYLNEKQLRQKWGVNYNNYWLRISQAVDETQSEVITYQDEMIEAVFHSTSAGYTENSENTWSKPLPYLKSVDSKLDENAPGFISQKTLSQNEMMRLLQNKYPNITLTNAPILSQIQVISRSQAGYILEIQIGNKVLTGSEVRGVFGLKSSNLTIKQQSDQVIFTTKGYGHGVGMSQYGANFMAKAGSNYIEILKHYYQQVEITKYNE